MLALDKRECFRVCVSHATLSGFRWRLRPRAPFNTSDLYATLQVDESSILSMDDSYILYFIDHLNAIRWSIKYS